MYNPVAVLISDVHYNLKNLALADAAMRQAIDKANSLKVPLIVAGDLHDTKALLRGECVSALLETFKLPKQRPLVLIGNHDLLNEKGTAHSLEFLKDRADIIEARVKWRGVHYFPYFNDPDACRDALKDIPYGSTVIMHQGLTKAWPGEYCHDHSAIRAEDVARLRVISGHYHRAQDIDTGHPRRGIAGLFSYIGTPYTTSFAEAEDGPKGFQILDDRGLLELVPTNLRKHVVIEMDAASYENSIGYTKINSDDLVWLKLRGPSLELDKLDKAKLGEQLGLPENYRLDKIPTDTAPLVIHNIEKKTGVEVLDELIDNENELISLEQRDELKRLAREVME